MNPIVVAKNIRYSYNKKIEALSDVNFEIQEKDFIGLIGPNGGGKSTLLKIILGLLTPDKGKITVFGKKPKESRAKIGYVPQYSQIDLSYPITVNEVIISGLLGYKKIGSRFKPEEKKKTEEILERMNLTDLKNKAIGELSGGQRQRVFLARALVREPKLLLLDEPTNNVDRESGEGLYTLLNELNKEITIIIVSHDVSVVSKYVNRVFCLNKEIACKNANEMTDDCELSAFKHVHHEHNCIIH